LGNLRVYTNGGTIVQITHDPADHITPAWSPDGRAIAYAGDSIAGQGWPHHIYSMRSDGSARTRLTSGAASDLDPSWSPDGSRIAFTRRGVTNQVWTMNADGSAQALLKDDASQPDWSPDGTKIVFVAGGSEVSVMSTDGSGATALHAGGSPSWSPDGMRIAFTTASGVAVMNSDGSGFGPAVTDHRLCSPMNPRLGSGSYCADSVFYDPAWTADGWLGSVSVVRYYVCGRTSCSTDIFVPTSWALQVRGSTFAIGHYPLSGPAWRRR
jgi:Tol biopolymer transport system component